MKRVLNPNESKRLSALQELKALETSNDDVLDLITKLTREIFDVPICLITLLDEHQQWFKSKIGTTLERADRTTAFCDHTIRSEAVFIVEDARLDDRFKNSPLVAGPPNIRFYAGAPLITREGFALGSLCLLADTPLQFSHRQKDMLTDLAAIVIDIIETRHAVALTDIVTRLPNRQRLIADLDLLQQQDSETSYLLILVDTLDTLYAYDIGRAMGIPLVEDILANIGTFLRSELNENEKVYSLVLGRFAIIKKLEDQATIFNDLQLAADKIQQNITADIPIKVHLHAGYTQFSNPFKLPQEIVREAMSALHEAIIEKQLLMPYQLDKDRHQLRAFSLLNDLISSVHSGEGLELLYQPKIRLNDKKLNGVEALLRWQHPTLGLISPSEFIPLAEKTPLITPLTDWVITQAIKQIASWQKSGMDINVSINITANNLLERDLVKRIHAALITHQVSPAMLEIECLETQQMVDSPFAVASLNALKQLGIKIALDDFGSGYSNLNYLQNIPAEVLKLDQSLVQAICSDYKSKVIVKSMIDMAHALSYSVIAEGVEDEATLLCLEEFNCDTVQGFYYSQPMAQDKIIDWSKAYS
jgi:EAL domain-containing protein (putative c-di-GMP-specific phosphodiesterase class I)/GGDEF domain-containing protein